ncbi:hypothetical protein D3C81_1842630 [compost metagenome]
MEDLLLDNEVIHRVVHQPFQHLADRGAIRFGAGQAAVQLVGLVHQPAMLFVDLRNSDFELAAPRHESHVLVLPLLVVLLCEWLPDNRGVASLSHTKIMDND